MNAFIAIYHRTPRFIDNHHRNSFLRYLPINPKESDVYKSPNERVQIFSYAVRARFGFPPLIRQSDSACTIDGIVLKAKQDEEIQQFQFSHNESFRQFEDITGEYSLVHTDGKELYATSDIGGSHSLYIAETEDLVAISNRSVCLLGVAGISHSLDENGITWKAFQGYIASPFTAFKEIRKIRNGSKVSVSADGNLKIRKASYNDLVNSEISQKFNTNPLRAFEDMNTTISSYLKQVYTTMETQTIDLPLSGGKDSRAILGFIIKAGLQDKLESIWTRGTLYSPEVLAAQDLCKAVGLDKLHKINRPAHFTKSKISSSMLVKTLNNHEGLLSLFDFAGVANWKNLRVQGHQNALRFGKFSKCRNDSYENFIEDALKSYSNPLGITLQVTNIEEQIQVFFSEHFQAGAPVQDLGDLYYLFERNLSWVAVLSNMDYCSGPITNPMMMGEVFRIAFNLPVSYRKNELFHFLSLYFNAPALLECPFSEQEWPSELLTSLHDIGLNYEGKFPKPYKSHKSFPNLKNPWVPNIKLDYYNALKPFALDVLDRHKSYFSNLLDVGAFKSFLQETTNPAMFRLYCSMGMYSSLMLKEYGSELFDGTMHEEIQKDLESRMEIPSQEDAKQIDTEKNEVWESLVTRHEQCIADLVRVVQQKTV